MARTRITEPPVYVHGFARSGTMYLHNVNGSRSRIRIRVPCGTKCLIAVAVPYTLPEYYPEPERFDIGRFAADRLEHRAPGA